MIDTSAHQRRALGKILYSYGDFSLLQASMAVKCLQCQCQPQVLHVSCISSQLSFLHAA